MVQGLHAAGEEHMFKVYGRLTSTASVSAAQKVVFIGVQLPVEQIRALLDRCLLTDDEERQGQSVWLEWCSPWDSLATA